MDAKRIEANQRDAIVALTIRNEKARNSAVAVDRSRPLHRNPSTRMAQDKAQPRDRDYRRGWDFLPGRRSHLGHDAAEASTSRQPIWMKTAHGPADPACKSMARSR